MSSDAFWMPFTPNRQFNNAPRLVDHAEGIMLYTKEGREVIDATAGLWCSNLGHCRPEIASAVENQLHTLDYSSIFNFSHEVGIKYAQRLVKFAPDGLDHVFFATSGSEAVETALKLAMQYWAVKGQSKKKRFIGREKAYHGVNFGGISVGGLASNFSTFGQWLMVDHLPHTLDIERNAFSRGLPENGLELADALEALLTLHDPATVAAVILEPIAGAGGVILPSQGYLQRIREICDKYDVLLIFDEVITGWGRLGSPFAAIEFDVIPDMITSAKGITNAAIPLSAVFLSNTIYDTCTELATASVEFFHGYTYSCHPVACAAGNACLDIYEREGLLTRASGKIGQYWENALHSLADLPQVVDIRNYGLIGAIELQPDANQSGIIGHTVLQKAWDKGVMVRGIGDAVCMSPPLIVEHHHIDMIINILREIIENIPVSPSRQQYYQATTTEKLTVAVGK